MKYKTKLGNHDGDSWEELCQFCLQTKFQKDYHEIPASPGDYGLDGFTRDGIAFQCYCPERECTDKDLYESQRNKITKDLKKLKTYAPDLEKILNGAILKEWILLTPDLKTNDVLMHCAAKTIEVRGWGLKFIDSNFIVKALDIKYISSEAPAALDVLDYTSKGLDITKKIEFDSEDKKEEDINEFEKDKNEQYETVKRKHTARFPSDDGKDYKSNVLLLTNNTIGSYLVGDDLLKEWESVSQDQLEKFMRIVGALEKKIQSMCASPNDKQALYKEINDLVKTTMDSEFKSLGEATRIRLSERVISDWLIRCPLNFE